MSILFEHDVVSTPGSFNLDEYAANQRNLVMTNIDPNQGEIYTIQIGNNVMKYFEGNGLGYLHNYFVQLPDGTILTISVVFASKTDASQYENLERQILSTFTLTPEPTQ